MCKQHTAVAAPPQATRRPRVRPSSPSRTPASNRLGHAATPLQTGHNRAGEQQARRSIRQQAFSKWQAGARLGWSLHTCGPAKQSHVTNCGTQRGSTPRGAPWCPRLEGPKGSAVREDVSTWKSYTSSELTRTPSSGLPLLPRGPVPGREC